MSSVYDNAVKLIEKGLAEKLIKYKSQKIKASSPDILQTLIDKEKNKLHTLQENLQELQTAIINQNRSTPSTEVRYYHGVQGMMQMLWNTLKADKETIGYSESGRIDVVGKQFKFRWFEETIRRKIHDRVIINPKKETLKHHIEPPEDKYVEQFQEIRILNENQLYITGDTTIYNNIFAVCYWKQGEIVGVEIENPELVKTQKSIFEEMWRLAEPIGKYINR